MLYADLLIILTMGVAVCFAKDIRRMIDMTIEEFERSFRGGGPRPPTHPLPADDSRILNRKPRRSKSELR